MNTSLTKAQQTKNIALYAVTNWLMYLTAPVLYIGIVQTSLCERLFDSDTVANLPTAAFFWAAVVPIFVAARFRSVSIAGMVLAIAFALAAAAGAAVATLLWWDFPLPLQLGAVILYGGAVGATMGLRNTFIWDVVHHGIASERHGLAYGLAFGVGPLFAVVGSLISQLLLSGTVQIPWVSPSQGFMMAEFTMEPFEFPLNYAILFWATVPILALMAILATRFSLPTVVEEPRPPFLAGLVQSAADILRDRTLVLAILAYLLVDAGFTITNNMSLYTQAVLGRHAQEFAGYQNALRFSFKMTAGLALGWILTRTNPKFGMLLTGGFCLLGVIWAIFVREYWFLLSFGLMGAGELYGTYYLNYIMEASRPERLRQNMAMLVLLGLTASIAPPIFGAISDIFGLRASFVAAVVVLCASLTVIMLGLPARPTPLKESDA